MRISPEVVHFLAEFWEMLAFLGNTVVFVIAGLVMTYRLDLRDFTAYDAGVLFILYGLSFAIRAVNVGLVWWFERATGMRRADWRDAVVTTWGGLRGAMGLALALIIFYDTERVCVRVRQRVLLHTSGVVFLTVVVNAISMRHVIQLLGLNEERGERVLIQRQALKRLFKATMMEEESIKRKERFATVVWHQAQKYYLALYADARLDDDDSQAGAAVSASEATAATATAASMGASSGMGTCPAGGQADAPRNEAMRKPARVGVGGGRGASFDALRAPKLKPAASMFRLSQIARTSCSHSTRRAARGGSGPITGGPPCSEPPLPSAPLTAGRLFIWQRKPSTQRKAPCQVGFATLAPISPPSSPPPPPPVDIPRSSSGGGGIPRSSSSSSSSTGGNQTSSSTPLQGGGHSAFRTAGKVLKRANLLQAFANAVSPKVRAARIASSFSDRMHGELAEQPRASSPHNNARGQSSPVSRGVGGGGRGGGRGGGGGGGGGGERSAGGGSRLHKLRARLRLSAGSSAAPPTTVESVEVRRRILMVCKQSYWNQFERGMINRQAAQYLRSLSDHATDQSRCDLDEWNAIEGMLKAGGIYLAPVKRRGLGGLLGGSIPPASNCGCKAGGRSNGGGGGGGGGGDRAERLGLSRAKATHYLLGGTPTGQAWRALSLRGKTRRLLGSPTWTAFVCALVIGCMGMTHLTRASSLAMLWEDAASLAAVEASVRGSSAISMPTTPLTTAQAASIGLRACTCLLFMGELAVRIVLAGSFVQVLADLLLLQLICVVLLDVASLCTYLAANGYAQYALYLRLLELLPAQLTRRKLQKLMGWLERRSEAYTSQAGVVAGGGGYVWGNAHPDSPAPLLHGDATLANTTTPNQMAGGTLGTPATTPGQALVKAGTTTSANHATALLPNGGASSGSSTTTSSSKGAASGVAEGGSGGPSGASAASATLPAGGGGASGGGGGGGTSGSGRGRMPLRGQLAVSCAGFAARLRRRMQVAQYRFAFNVLCGFLFAREEAVDLLTEWTEEETQPGVRSILASAVMAISRDIASVRAYLVLLRQEDYELHASLTTMMAARTVLNSQRRMVKHLLHEGAIEKPEAMEFSSVVDQRMERLMRSPPDIRLPDNRALLRRVGWLRDAPDDLLQALLGGKFAGVAPSELHLSPNQPCVAQGQLNDCVYLLKRGTGACVRACARACVRVCVCVERGELAMIRRAPPHRLVTRLFIVSSATPSLPPSPCPFPLLLLASARHQALSWRRARARARSAAHRRLVQRARLRHTPAQPQFLPCCRPGHRPRAPRRRPPRPHCQVVVARGSHVEGDWQAGGGARRALLLREPRQMAS